MGSNQRIRRANRREILIFIALLAIAIFTLNYVLNPSVPTRTGTFRSANNQVLAKFELEIARTDEQKRLGLMYRKSLARDRGMLFEYPAPQKLSFWMKDTYIPLDMIFLDQGFKVVGVLHQVPILNTESRTIEAHSQYLVEINAGLAKAFSIEIGSLLHLE